VNAYFKRLYSRFRADLAKAHKSLTLWFNGVAGALIAALPFAQEQLPQLQDYVSANVYHYLMAVVVAGNILLRFKTRSALADKP
jgi:hypothetical protein